MTSTWVGLIAGAGLALSGAAVAQPGKDKAPDQAPQQQHQHGDKGGGDKGGGDKGGGGDKAGGPGGGAGHAKHQHHARNGHALLGDKLKQDGKHAVGKFKNRDVVAEVKHGKVVAMSAGDIQPKRVRSKTRMAMDQASLTLASWAPGGAFQLAQYDSYYYGYCFDDGYDYDCYWYPADEVDYQDYAWDDYDPYW